MSANNWSAEKGNFFFYEEGYTPPKQTNALQLGVGIFLSNGKEGNKIVSSHAGKKSWDETRDYLAPIPKSEIPINKNLVQNPNWK